MREFFRKVLKMKKKIYFVIPHMGGGGAQKVITHLVNNLTREKFDLTLVLFKKEGPNLKLVKKDVKIIDLESSRIRNGVFKLFKVLIKDRPDIMFTSLGGLNAIISPFLFLLKGTKCIARETNIPSFISKMSIKQGNKKYIFIDFLYKVFYKNYDLVVAQSDDMKMDFIKNYRFETDRIVKINNPVDFEFLKSKLEENSKNPLDNGKINLVSAGRLTYQKGLDMLIDQMITIENLDVKLTILGTGELEGELKERVRKLGLEDKIDFLGYQENPYIYFKNSDIFVLPSRIEGFPNVALENIGLGIPILANNFTGGINEIIVNGLNGKIIDYTNYDFEKGIKDVIKYKENKKEIIRDTVDRFEKSKIIKKYEEVFTEIV